MATHKKENVIMVIIKIKIAIIVIISELSKPHQTFEPIYAVFILMCL